MNDNGTLARLIALEHLVIAVVAEGITTGPAPAAAMKAVRGYLAGVASTYVQTGLAHGEAPEGRACAENARALVMLAERLARTLALLAPHWLGRLQRRDAVETQPTEHTADRRR